MKHYYKDVPGIGNLALTRHAQKRMQAEGIGDAEVLDTLLNGISQRDGMTVLFRERHGIRLVIQTQPSVNSGAAVCLTGFRILP